MGGVKIGLRFIRLFDAFKERKRLITTDQLFFVLWDIGEWRNRKVLMLIN